MEHASINTENSRGSGVPIIVMGAMLALAAVPAVMMAWPRQAHDLASASAVKAAPAVVAATAIRFEDRPDGSAAVLDASDGFVLATMKAGDGGFVRTTLRLLTVERRRHNTTGEAPFQVTHWNTGSVTIHDPEIGKTIELKAFGATNAESFAQLLETRRK